MLSLLRRARFDTITVDYAKEPMLPNGADALVTHQPLGQKELTLSAQQLKLVPMTPGESYQWFSQQHPEYVFADVQVLDALIAVLYPNGKTVSRRAEQKILGDFWGQIFFLGTSFESVMGEAYAFLNWRTQLPATRYMCPAVHPVNHTVPCVACVITAHEHIR